MAEDIKTLAIVLRRTNYGEADRILNLITPNGKISAIAKGVRKARSKLAGGIEMFTLAELLIHSGRSELGIVTSARMVEHYSEIMKDYERMTLASKILKKVGTASEHTDAPEWFTITRQCLTEINTGTSLAIIEAWFWLNLMRVSGEEVNLYRDARGEKLKVGTKYDWSVSDQAFKENSGGEYGEDEIKLLRLMTRNELKVIKRIKTEPDVINNVYGIIKIWEN